jgi:hypothetical protein
LERKKERDAKIARGEEVGPEEQDPTAEEEVGALGLLKFLLYVTILVLFTGKFITGSFLWDYEVRWAQLKTLYPVRDDALCWFVKLFSQCSRLLSPGPPTLVLGASAR